MSPESCDADYFFIFLDGFLVHDRLRYLPDMFKNGAIIELQKGLAGLSCYVKPGKMIGILLWCIA